MPECPRCQRPVALARRTCLYCGAPLPEAGPAKAPPAEERPAPDSRRALLILDARGAEAGRLQAALHVSAYDAGLLVRRGGFHLLRIGEEGETAEAAARLQGAGLAVLRIPEAELQALPPVMARGGRCRDDGLDLQTDQGNLRLSATDLLLVVQGPITRQYQTSTWTRLTRLTTASLEGGHRLHLHRRGEAAPLELDVASFAFGETPLLGSSLLELLSWMDAVAAAVPRDDGFRSLPPALAPATEAGGEMATALLAEMPRTRRKGDAPLVLDNLAQFRFYSAWRGAVERRLSAREVPVLPSPPEA